MQNNTHSTITSVISMAVIVTMVFLPSFADTYQYIISGYPADNENRSVASAGIAMATSTLSTAADASALEARYRTWDESDGVALRTDKFRATIILIK